MSNQDWYARRLGQAQPQARERPGLPGRFVQPQQHPQQQRYQQAVAQYPQSPGNQQMYEQQAHGQHPMPQQPQYVQTFEGHQHTVQEMQNYRGGVAQQMNPNPCPQCGGNQYFEHIKTKGRGPEPAGHCFNCGYNELFDQGDQAVWGSGQPVIAMNGTPQQAPIQVNSSPWQNGMAPA